MKIAIVLISIILQACGSLDIRDYIQETKGGNVFVPHILEKENLITCKTVAYCKYGSVGLWEECKKGLKALEVHYEKVCIDLGRDDDPFFIPMDQWKDKYKHEFGEYRNEDIFKILKNTDYIKEHTDLYQEEIPGMVEKFKEFHK